MQISIYIYIYRQTYTTYTALNNMWIYIYKNVYVHIYTIKTERFAKHTTIEKSFFFFYPEARLVSTTSPCP